MLVYKRCLKNIMTTTAEIKIHNAEMLWTKIDNAKNRIINIGVIYMPQESRTPLIKLTQVYKEMAEKIAEIGQKGESILILGDMNCKVGSMIMGNTEEITKGGRLLLKLLKKFKLKIVNADSCCEGLWTRIEGSCRSVLDYVMVFEEDMNLVEQMEVDEEKDITPYYIEKTGGKDVRKYTDHCMISAKMNINFQEDRSKTYALVLDEEGYKHFRERLSEEKISCLFDKEEDIRKSYAKWNDAVLGIRDSCSRRVKIRKKWKVCRKLTVANKKIRLK